MVNKNYFKNNYVAMDFDYFRIALLITFVFVLVTIIVFLWFNKYLK